MLKKQQREVSATFCFYQGWANETIGWTKVSISTFQNWQVFVGYSTHVCFTFMQLDSFDFYFQVESTK